MTEHRSLIRMVDWALGLTLFTITVIVFVLPTCTTATAMVSSASIRMQLDNETRPPDSATDSEKEVWDAQRQSARRVVHDTTGSSIWPVVIGVGLPTVGLLIAVYVILSRLRGRLIRQQ